MPLVGTALDRFDALHRAERERAIQVREQRAPARLLPFQRRPERLRIDRDEQEVFLPGKMLGERGFDLLGGGEMDVAVLVIGGRPAENLRTLGLAPQGRRANFVNYR